MKWKDLKRKKQLSDYYWKYLYHPINDAYWWIRYRTTDKYHIVNTGLKPGYWDDDHQMLHANFSILVAHIEQELAWMKLICYSKEQEKVPWYQSYKSYCNKHRKRLGLEYLDIRMEAKVDELSPNYDPNNDLEINHENTWGWASKEMKELYLWWIKEREEEWNRYNNMPFSKTSDETWKNSFEEEDRLLEKDTQQLIRLMKVRPFLWT